MKLHIKNIAKIKEAEIVVDGITVIAGANNTGKSTVGKVLFGMFQTLQNKFERILEAKTKYVDTFLSLMFQSGAIRRTDSSFWDLDWPDKVKPTLVRRIVEKYENSAHHVSKDDVDSCIQEFVHKYPQISELISNSEKEYTAYVERIQKFLNVTDDDTLSQLFRQKFNNIFNKQINSLDASSEEAFVHLSVKETNTIVKFKNDVCVGLNSPISLDNKAVYIDNPLILNKLSLISEYGPEVGILRMFSETPMEEELINLLMTSHKNDSVGSAIDNVLKQERLSEVFEIINSVIEATVLPTHAGFELWEKGVKYGVRFANLSFGVRPLVIFKMLLENDLIKDKDVLILDEPEIHLHPQWQVAFAQLIVLLQKEYKLSVVITTHSPYFMEAISLYTRHYLTERTTHFYLSELEGRRAVLHDVTENLEAIYKKMVAPYRVLDEIAANLN